MELIRQLDLRQHSVAGRSDWLSAGSGLLRTGEEFCVVADDELHLGRFPVASTRPGRLQRLFAGVLPARPKRRKKRKPDLKVLMRLPRDQTHPHGALLALGSGSGERRRRGAVLALGAQGHVTGRALGVDAAPLFAQLSKQLDDLNIEGGWVADGCFNLLHRGNKGGSPNALLRWRLQPLLRGLLTDRELPAVDPFMVREFDLGDMQGVPLCFTDASPLPGGGWLFSAVAEDTLSARDDGPSLASAIGRVDAQSRLRWIKPVPRRYKIEGIEVDASGPRLAAWLVTDADDPQVPASLLRWSE